MRIEDLWRWEGTLDRGPYALVGVLGFAIKHNLDRFVAAAAFHRPWGIFNYWVPLGEAVRITSLSRRDAAFLATMVVLALPFIWVGVALTLKRLRAAGLPPWLVALFFFPFLNLLFFVLLCVIPSREETETQPARGAPFQPLLDRMIPDHPVGTAAMALLITTILGVALTALGTTALRDYGWGLFVALPFCLGLCSVLLYGYHRPRRLGSCLMVATTSVLLLGGVLLAVAIEGAICIAMAAPIAGALALLGAWIGYLIQRRPTMKQEAPAMLLALVAAVPLLMGAEAVEKQAPPLIVVQTTMDVNAPPEKVWQRVVAFTQLPEPDDWMFRLGIAYPMRAEIQGQGAGAVRHCVFSTGSFVEPIEVWDAPRLLKFSVTSNPAPMQEWTPYSTVHPPHLDGFLISKGGQFHLVALPDGRTHVEATTWYHHNMWPAAYWQLWSDAIIHRIHVRVLEHVQHLAESPV